MRLLDLPLELLRGILEQMVLSVGLKRAPRLRLVNKFFAHEIIKAIFFSRMIDHYEGRPPVQPSIAVTSMYLQTRVLRDPNDAIDLVRTIRETVRLLLDEDERHCDSIRGEYIAAVAALTLKTMPRSRVLISLSSEFRNESSQGYDLTHLLAAAAYTGKISILKTLLEKGIDVNKGSEYFGYPLQAAAYQGKNDIVQLLLGYGSNINSGTRPERLKPFSIITSGVPRTPLQAASFGGHEDTVRVLLTPELNNHTSVPEYKKAIMEACRGGHPSLLKLLLESRDITKPSELYSWMLFQASKDGYDSVVRVILNSGASINLTDNDQTCLQYASLLGHEKVVRLLLERGADQTAGRSDKSPLHMASAGGYRRVAEILLENGAEINGGWPIRQCWLTPFAAAASYGQDHMLPFLLERGASLPGTEIGQRALLHAIDAGYESTVGILANYGVDVNEVHKEHEGWEETDTPMLKAILTGHDHIVRKLTDLGAQHIDPLKTSYAEGFLNGELPFEGFLDAPTGYTGPLTAGRLTRLGAKHIDPLKHWYAETLLSRELRQREGFSFVMGDVCAWCRNEYPGFEIV